MRHPREEPNPGSVSDDDDFTYIANDEDNDRYGALSFVVECDALVHGFAGYFDATLFDDVHVSIEPSTLVPKVIRDDNRYQTDLKDQGNA